MFDTTKKEKRSAGHDRLLGQLIDASINNQSKIAELYEAGRRLSVIHGLRSDVVRAKAAEVDAVFERDARIGAIIQRLKKREPGPS